MKSSFSPHFRPLSLHQRNGFHPQINVGLGATTTNLFQTKRKTTHKKKAPRMKLNDDTLRRLKRQIFSQIQSQNLSFLMNFSLFSSKFSYPSLIPFHLARSVVIEQDQIICTLRFGITLRSISQQNQLK
jgi:hypothetical protein